MQQHLACKSDILKIFNMNNKYPTGLIQNNIQRSNSFRVEYIAAMWINEVFTTIRMLGHKAFPNPSISPLFQNRMYRNTKS